MDLALPFRVEYTPRDHKGKCKVCEKLFIHRHIRLAEMSLANRHDAVVPIWFHKKCFFDNFKVKSTDEIEHLERMKYDDQVLVQEKVVLKFPDDRIERKIAAQTGKMLENRKLLTKLCHKDALNHILEANGSCEVNGYNNTLDRCADFVTFGALFKCSKCKNGDMLFSKHGYTCNGMMDEWTDCGNFEEKPKRKKCIIPDDLDINEEKAMESEMEFFVDYEPVVEDRAVRRRVLPIENIKHVTVSAFATGGSTDDIEESKEEEEIHFKDGTVVDSRSKLSGTVHVYKHKGILYSSVLVRTDLARNKNSYYKIQILETDEDQDEKKYFLFTAWGRIGTKHGTFNEDEYNSALMALKKFKQLFKEKTGNDWNSPDFHKIPKMYCPIDVDYSDVVKINTKIASKLSPEVEDLMKLIFNVPTMTRAMNNYKLDLEKMPLGKLSAKQMENARKTLEELKKAIENQSSQERVRGLSTKFYSLVPHNVGVGNIPIIDSTDLVTKKIDMVVSLQKIQQAYAIMVQSGNADENSFDAYYKKLNTEIIRVDPKSYGYELIRRYIDNTSVHGKKLSILEIFSVKRNGEKERYEPFKHFDNRMLLWHGSAITNFASILSNGFKISPAAHGSMFGRGLYFADMASKSANYCYATPPDNTILMALSEIALGKMHELRKVDNTLLKAPAGTDSVKGVGRVQPNPNYAKTRSDGVVIPYGKPQDNPACSTNPSDLKYNEFIVYNEAQVNIQYLVKLKVELACQVQ